MEPMRGFMACPTAARPYNNFTIQPDGDRFVVMGNHIGTNDPWDWAWGLAGTFDSIEEAQAFVANAKAERSITPRVAKD